LTYHHTTDSSDADRPATEDEHKSKITPAMIEAGAEVIWQGFYDVAPYGSDLGRLWARLVFEAMEKHLDCP
jgi:hypothetical protein